MKIGIFLGYGPQVILNKEGLGRYIAGLLKGFMKKDNTVTIACPYWLNDSLEDLFNDFSVDKEKVFFVQTKKNPLIWEIFKIYNNWKKKKSKSKILIILKEKVYEIVKNSVERIVACKLWPVLLIISASGFIVSIISAVVVKIIKIINRILFFRVLNIARKIVDILLAKLKSIFNIDDALLLIFNLMLDSENNELIKKINKLGQCDVWFIPSIFWPQVNNIKNGIVVINAPDLVSENYPVGFSDVYNANNAIDKCRKTLRGAEYFITYCEYIKKSLLMDECSIRSSHSVAIAHADNSMLDYINIDKRIVGSSTINYNKKFSRGIIQGNLYKCSADLWYKFNICTDNMHYIFYASQCRPHKNMLNLIKAYEYLLRKKFIRYKLFLTGSSLSKEIKEYIKEHCLNNEVIIFPAVPAKVLAALYCCADLVVNPTLYEGGFPFTFGEGMSVGTPSIMSDIPQTRDVLSNAGLDEIMFDPYNWLEMANKIEWGLKNKEYLYDLELPLYEQMSKRTYEVVADDYIKAFEYFIELDKKEKSEK